jgi:hypothetical protein
MQGIFNRGNPCEIKKRAAGENMLLAPVLCFPVEVGFQLAWNLFIKLSYIN